RPFRGPKVTPLGIGKALDRSRGSQGHGTLTCSPVVCRIDFTSAGSRDTAKCQIPNLPSEFTASNHSPAN
ncbi:MAG: hypothetical protein WKF77_14635, partial [Planctomycetaceae bacterium]